MSQTLVCPSLLAANFGNLEQSIEIVNESQADYLHMDIMDGVFVPNISFGPPVCQFVQKLCKKPLDYHLMLVDPNPYLETFRLLGAEVITVHYETCKHLHRTISQIKQLGAKAGVVLNPHTSVSLLDNIISEIDVLLIMSVNPGFGGQTFIPSTYDKIREAREMSDKKNSKLWIEVDGGVCESNAGKLISAGANMLVAGSSVFGSQNPVQTIANLKAF